MIVDKIIIKGLKLFAYHGVNEEEKQVGQNFIFDIVVHIDRKNVRFNDLIESTVSYSQIIKILKSTVTQSKFDLIETVAEVVAKKLIDKFDSICKIEVEVKKPEAPMKVDFDYVSVYIVRTRDDYVK